MSSTYDKIKEFHKTSRQFFNKYVKNFKNEMPLEMFHKFRLYFINLSIDVK